MSLKSTALTSVHRGLNAKMAAFAGFDMPLQYSSIKAEVLAVRNNAGLFDVGHMGEFWATGLQALEFVDYILTNDIKTPPDGKAIYSPLCREDGTVIDDLIAYKFSSTKILICVNAANIEKDWSWMSPLAKDFEVTFTNKSDETSLLALQGPDSENILSQVLRKDLKHIPYYGVEEFFDEAEKIILARTGYTGEDGFEIFCSHEYVQILWNKLISHSITPCGLASRDVLRLEVCYPLYGHELNDELTPLDSALKWTVRSEKEKFIGKDKLQNHTSQKRLVKLLLERGIPREGHRVLNKDGEPIGTITSGTHSVVLGKGIALAHIDRKSWPEDKLFFVDIRNKLIPAVFCTKPFVTGGHK